MKFQVQQVRNQKFICNVASPYDTRDEAQKQVEACYAADWQRTHTVTPTTHYTIVPVLESRLARE